MLRAVLALHAMLLCSTASWAAPSEPAIPARVKELEARMRKAPTLESRLDVFRELEAYVKGELQRLERSSSSMDREERRTFTRLDEYLGRIDDSGFTKSSCDDYRRAIYRAISPSRNPPPSIPPEAQEAFEVLTLLCGDR